MVAAADLIDCVFAVRHSLSAPIWLKPSTMRWSSLPREQPASSARLRVMTVKMRREEFIASPMNVSERVGAAEGMAARLDGEPVDQRRAQRRQIDLEFVAGLHADVVDEAQRGGAKEMQVDVARHAMLPVLEVVVLEVGDGVAHVALAGEHGLFP